MYNTSVWDFERIVTDNDFNIEYRDAR